MDIRHRFAAKKTTELVEIMESRKNYTAEAYLIAEEELLSRQLATAELIDIARNFVQAKAADQMDRLNPLNDELQLSESYFLSKTEVREIYEIELKALMERKEGFRFDVWQYAIGGFV